MARKLKTFTTSAGFFDLAIAAPSMKAALDAWDAGRNLFRDGFAKVATDPAVIAATTARPGLVLRRPDGSNAPFSEQAALPESLPVGRRKRPAMRTMREDKTRHGDRQRHERVRRQDEARRDRAIAAAQVALEKARRACQAKVAEIEKARSAPEKRLQA